MKPICCRLAVTLLILLLLVPCLSLSSVAAGETVSVDISSLESGVAVDFYLLFKAEKVDGGYIYTINTDGNIQSLLETVTGKNAANEDEMLNYIASLEGAALRAFATTLVSKLHDGVVSVGSISNASLTTNLVPGYYLVNFKDSNNKYQHIVANFTTSTTLNVKRSEPIVDLLVHEVNESTGDNRWSTVADFDAGTLIDIQANVTLPESYWDGGADICTVYFTVGGSFNGLTTPYINGTANGRSGGATFDSLETDSATNDTIYKIDITKNDFDNNKVIIRFTTTLNSQGAGKVNDISVKFKNDSTTPLAINHIYSYSFDLSDNTYTLQKKLNNNTVKTYSKAQAINGIDAGEYAILDSEGNVITEFTLKSEYVSNKMVLSVEEKNTTNNTFTINNNTITFTKAKLVITLPETGDISKEVRFYIPAAMLIILGFTIYFVSSRKMNVK